ncbi:MAG: GNAT family N-acetyltransferase [Kiritimatiellae bacterium]|nr:GNAT family N-acetyltransferase [Kiritimatiellia bacterium]
MNLDPIEKYGVVLRRLQPIDLEVVRHWRNHQKISQYMIYREHITEEMQIAWFDRINNDRNYYFIIEWEQRGVGLINIKDINMTERSGESGIFIWDDTCLNSDVPPRAVLALFDYAYDILKLEFIRAHVIKTNTRAIRFNKYMGFKLQSEQEMIENQLYIQTHDNFFEWRAKVVCLF